MRPVVISDGTAGIIVSGSGSNSLIIIKMTVKINPEARAYFPALLSLFRQEPDPLVIIIQPDIWQPETSSKIVTGKTTTAKKG